MAVPLLIAGRARRDDRWETRVSFTNALSGMQAASYELDILGNNIANTETVGFKSSQARFGDVYANTLSSGQKGLGTQTLPNKTDFQAGTLELTGRPLDIAIQGQGFFRFAKGEQALYTRDGQVTLTPEGFLENAQGARLVGYGEDGGALEPLQVPFDPLPGRATTNMSVSLNLDAGAATLSPDSDVSPSFTAPVVAHGADGTAYDVQLSFTKVAANEWQVTAQASGGNENDVLTDASLANLRFDAEGQPVNEAPRNLNFELGNGETLAFSLDLSSSTQFGNSSTVREASQDGYASGDAVGVVIEGDGRVVRSYTNERSREVGQIALAHFISPQNLVQEGENAWREGEGSGPAEMGVPGTFDPQRGVWGRLQGQAVESSNVELNQELIDLLSAQRAYQVNSRSVSVQNEMLQTAINLR